MRTLCNRLLFLLAVLSALPSFSYAQVRESGTGEPGPVKSQHLTAELISDSGTIAPGGKSRVALALMLEPGWHVYWFLRRGLGRASACGMVGADGAFPRANAVSCNRRDSRLVR